MSLSAHDVRRVVQLVTHCAGRRDPPRRDDRDPRSVMIRHVCAFLLVCADAKKCHGPSQYACDRLEIEAERGRGAALDLLLLVIGQIVEAECMRAARLPKPKPVRTLAIAPPPATPVAPQAVHTCAVPFDRAACPRERPCPRVECRYHLPVTGECALDCARLGGMEQVQIALHLGVTRSQVWNDENRALAKLRKRHPRLAEYLEGVSARQGGWNEAAE